MHGFLRSSSLYSNKLEPCAVKNIEVMKLSQSVGVTLDVSYTRLGVFLQLTSMNFTSVAFLTLQVSSQKNLNLESCKMQELLTVVSVTSRLHNYLIYTCAILLLWLQRLPIRKNYNIMYIAHICTNIKLIHS